MSDENEEKFILPKDRPGYKPSIQNENDVQIKIYPTGEREIIGNAALLEKVDISDKNIERIARGYILGTEAVGRKKEVRALLEDKVIGRIGRKGKYVTDKLFELIDGVYITEKQNGKEIHYYKQPPNLGAIIYALDRVLGKPQQAKPDEREKQGIQTIESIIKRFADGSSVEQFKKTTEVKA